MDSIKAKLWQILKAGIRLCPWRLRLAFLEQPLVMALDFMDLRIVAHSSEEYYIRAKSATKEPELVQWIQSMPNDVVFVDIGANVGTYSLMVARSKPRSRILAVEPAGTSFASLCQNIVLNDLSNRITPICAAIDPIQAPLYLRYSSFQPGAALHRIGRIGTGRDGHDVLSYSFSRLLPLVQFAYPTYVKIDVDGGELRVLAAMNACLEHIQSIMIEVEDQNVEQVNDILRDFKQTGNWSHAPGPANYRYERV